MVWCGAVRCGAVRAVRPWSNINMIVDFLKAKIRCSLFLQLGPDISTTGFIDLFLSSDVWWGSGSHSVCFNFTGYCGGWSCVRLFEQGERGWVGLVGLVGLVGFV